MDWTFARTCVRMTLCSNNGDWLRPPRPLAAGAGRAGRGEALRPAGGYLPPARKTERAEASEENTASPEGVMTMIRTMTATGTRARNRVPGDTGPGSAGLASGDLFDAEPN